MDDTRRTEICPGDGGSVGNPQDILKVTPSFPVGGDISHRLCPGGGGLC